MELLLPLKINMLHGNWKLWHNGVTLNYKIRSCGIYFSSILVYVVLVVVNEMLEA